MKRIFTLLVAATLTTFTFAQEDDGNLVKNGSFEDIGKKKVKAPGQIELALGWKSATLSMADLYSPTCKKGGAGAPKNQIGEEDALDGSNYAGVRMYAYKDKFPRSYIYSELKEELKAGKKYCVTFHVSFADLSKYAVNNLGAYFSEEELTAKNTGVLQASPQVMQRTNRIFQKQFYWEGVCNEFTAKGGEKFITIGNFQPTLKTKYLKVKKPRGFTSPQVYDGYYYIDNVSVIPSDQVDNCSCEKNPGGRVFVEKRTFESDPDDQPMGLKKIHNYKIQFQMGSATLNDIYNEDLEKAAATLGAEKETSIKVIGYIDNTEADESGDLGDRRATNVAKYLESKGVPSTRIEVTSMGTDDAVAGSGDKKNCRVVIMVEGREATSTRIYNDI